MGSEHAGCVDGAPRVTFYPCLGHASQTTGSGLEPGSMLLHSIIPEAVQSTQPDAESVESDFSVQWAANSAAHDFDLCAMD